MKKINKKILKQIIIDECEEIRYIIDDQYTDNKVAILRNFKNYPVILVYFSGKKIKLHAFDTLRWTDVVINHYTVHKTFLGASKSLADKIFNRC